MSLSHRTPGLVGRECAVGIRLATLGPSAEAYTANGRLAAHIFREVYFRFWLRVPSRTLSRLPCFPRAAIGRGPIEVRGGSLKEFETVDDSDVRER
jgi:hypothetical protein